MFRREILRYKETTVESLKKKYYSNKYSGLFRFSLTWFDRVILIKSGQAK